MIMIYGFSTWQRILDYENDYQLLTGDGITYICNLLQVKTYTMKVYGGVDV
jgi:hypothetical protein